MSDVTESFDEDTVEAPDGELVTQGDFERDPEKGELLPMHPKHRGNAGGGANAMIVAKERRMKAISLRMSGASYAEIAKECGYASPDSAGAAIRDEIKKLGRESAHELRAVQYERLNTMLLVLQPGVMSGDPRYIAQAQSVMRDMNALMGIGGEMQEEVKSGDNYLVVIDGASPDYIDALKHMAGEGPRPESETDASLHPNAIPATVVEDIDTGVTEGNGDGNEESATDSGEDSP